VEPGERTQRGYYVSEPCAENTERPAPAETIGARDHSGLRMGGPSQLRRFAQSVAAFLAEELGVARPDGANIPVADVSRRRGKEMRKWRREQGADECSVRTEYQDQDGESSWSKSQAAELLGISKRKQKQSKSSDR